MIQKKRKEIKNIAASVSKFKKKLSLWIYFKYFLWFFYPYSTHRVSAFEKISNNFLSFCHFFLSNRFLSRPSHGFLFSSFIFLPTYQLSEHVIYFDVTDFFACQGPIYNDRVCFFCKGEIGKGWIRNLQLSGLAQVVGHILFWVMKTYSRFCFV